MDIKKTNFTVVQEGNRRGDNVSKEEIIQAVNDLSSWFSTNAKDIAQELSKHKPVSESNLKNLKANFSGTIPNSLEVVLSVHDGGILLKDNYKSLSAE
jgi:cell wall assembly regulator SMI1